jgi:hypothetical protein
VKRGVPEGKQGVVHHILFIPQERVGEVEAIVALVSHLPATRTHIVLLPMGAAG